METHSGGCGAWRLSAHDLLVYVVFLRSIALIVSKAGREKSLNQIGFIFYAGRRSAGEWGLCYELTLQHES